MSAAGTLPSDRNAIPINSEGIGVLVYPAQRRTIVFERARKRASPERACNRQTRPGSHRTGQPSAEKPGLAQRSRRCNRRHACAGRRDVSLSQALNGTASLRHSADSRLDLRSVLTFESRGSPPIVRFTSYSRCARRFERATAIEFVDLRPGFLITPAR